MADDIGPPRPPPGAVDDEEEEEQEAGPPPPPQEPPPPPGDANDGDAIVGPLPPPVKRKRGALSAADEALYLSNLPCAEMYERSFSHREAVATSSEFFITASADGVLKFWKKRAQTSASRPRATQPPTPLPSHAHTHLSAVEFVKQYRSHPGAVVDVAASADGELLCSIGQERGCKVYDVLAYDMCGLLTLAFAPGACEWAYARGEAVARLAIADAASGAVHVFDGRDGGGPTAGASPAAPLLTVALHAHPVRCLRFNPPLGCVVSSDAGGQLELWSPWTGTFAASSVSFRFKADTDLYAHAAAKTAPLSLGVSGDGEQFCTVSGDRRVRVFRTRTGRLRCVLDESLDAAAAAQRAGPPAVRLEEIDYGRRAAAERELGRSWAGAPPFATPAAAAAPPGQPPPPPPPPPGPNAVFDESGHFLIYATHLGVKVVSLDAPGRVARLLGRVEAGERFTRLALFQGAPGRDKRARGGGAGGDEAAARARAAPGGAVGGAGAPPPASADPTLVCCAFRKPRLYLFTRREPVDPGDEPGGGGRDVFNERPTAEDAAARALLAPAPASAALPCGATIHTSLGDVGVRLYGAEAPRTVENWATLARTGYYDGLLFHRVVKGFMLQTGDPLGDGTGGASCWGGEFEDEIRRDLRHDRPYTLSMANAGPNTNGSQFFITTVATPWLDGKHTVFGRLTRGADVVHTIERAKTLRGDKPATDIRMLGITLE